MVFKKHTDIVGFGHALSYTAAYIIVPYYFEKRRGMATGVAIAGSGIGNIVCAPLMRYLLTEYTWRSFVVIEGGLILQCCVFGALFRAVPVVRLEPERKPVPDKPVKEIISMETEPMLKIEENEPEEPIRVNGSIRNGSAVQEPVNRSRRHSDVAEYHQTRHPSALPSIPESTVVTKGEKRHRLYSHQLVEANRTFSLDGSTLNPERQTRRHTSASGSRPFLRKDIYYANSLRQLDEYRSNPDVYSQSAWSIPVPTASEKKSIDLVDTDQPRPDGSDLAKPGRWSRFSNMIGLNLLNRNEFLTFAGAIFFLYFGYYVPYTVLYDFALERGVPDRGAVVLVSIMGVANTLGRVLLGSVADFRWVNRIVFFSFIMFLMGASCCFCTFYSNFYVLAVFAAVFAMCVGKKRIF